MNRTSLRFSPIALLLLAACAPKLVLPPIAPAPEQPERGAAFRAELPAIPAEAPAVAIDQDAGLSLKRYAVTTHPGVYSGWVQKPQLTFFAISPLTSSPSPISQIGLIFRTLEPDAVLGTNLTLECPDQTATIGVAVRSQVIPTGNTQSHFLTYWLPIERVADFARCNTGTLKVGQMQVRFTDAQLGGLRRLLTAVGANTGAT